MKYCKIGLITKYNNRKCEGGTNYIYFKSSTIGKSINLSINYDNFNVTTVSITLFT